MLYAVLKVGRAIVVLIQGTSPESQVSKFIDGFGAEFTNESVRQLFLHSKQA